GDRGRAELAGGDAQGGAAVDRLGLGDDPAAQLERDPEVGVVGDRAGRDRRGGGLGAQDRQQRRGQRDGGQPGSRPGTPERAQAERGREERRGRGEVERRKRRRGDETGQPAEGG